MNAGRGIFHHPERAKQLLSFEGLTFGRITPTDFDLFLDFGGRAFVLAEIKRDGVQILRGQELALERATDAWQRAGVPTLTLVASHTVDIGDVRVGDAIVMRFRWRQRWRAPKDTISVSTAIERFYAAQITRLPLDANLDIARISHGEKESRSTGDFK